MKNIDMLEALNDVCAKLEAWAEFAERQSRNTVDVLLAEKHSNKATNYRALCAKLRPIGQTLLGQAGMPVPIEGEKELSSRPVLKGG